MNLLYLMVNINEKIILGSLTKEELGENIRQITMPLRPRKKQTFAIEWESSLNTVAQCAALVRGSILFCVSFSRKKDKKNHRFSHGKVTFWFVYTSIIIIWEGGW